MIELARQFGRYGYRRIAALLRDAGWEVNDKRVERLWRREARGLHRPGFWRHTSPALTDEGVQLSFDKCKLTDLEAEHTQDPTHGATGLETLMATEMEPSTRITRTANIGSHGALFFLARFASPPRTTQLMFAAPVYKAPHIMDFVDMMREAATRTSNIPLDDKV